MEYLVILGVIAILALAAWRAFGSAIKCRVLQEGYVVGNLEDADLETALAICRGGRAAGGEARSTIGTSVGAPGARSRGCSGNTQPTPTTTPATPSSPASGTASPPGSSSPSPAAAAAAAAAARQARADQMVQDMLTRLCPQNRAFLADLQRRNAQITVYDSILYNDPRYDGTQWTTVPFNAGGTQWQNEIDMIDAHDADENAATLYHEGTHMRQPDTWTLRQKEYDAYRKEEEWRIARGLPPHDPAFRRTVNGRPVANMAAIRSFVDSNYPSLETTSPSGVRRRVTGHRASDGYTQWTYTDGTRRWTEYHPPQVGDSYSDPHPVIQPPGGVPIDIARLQCP